MPPFKLRKVPKQNLFWVVDATGKHYSKEGLPKEKAEAQMRALYASDVGAKKGGKKVEKWIQKATSEKDFKAGAFTKQALRHGMTPKEFAEEVLAHPEKYEKRTVKRAQFLKNIEGLHGAGFFGDWYNKAKTAVQRIVNVASKGVRKDYPPSARKTIQELGDGVIVELKVRRDPIQSLLNTVLNTITLGKWNELRGRLSYDKLFHLGLIAKIEKAGRFHTIVIEKNEVLNIGPAKPEKEETETMMVPLPAAPITLNHFLKQGEEAAGKDFFLYDAFNNNCQDFVLGLLKANFLGNENVSNFVKQPIEELVKGLPGYTHAIAKGATDLGAAFNYVLEGDGHNRHLVKLLGGCGLCHLLRGGETHQERMKRIYGNQDTEKRMEIKDEGVVQEDGSKIYEIAGLENPMCFVQGPGGKEYKGRRTPEECKALSDDAFKRWEEVHRPANAKFFRPAVEGLVKIGDLAAKFGEKVGVPKAVLDVYKQVAPPGSEYRGQGKAAPVVIPKSKFIKEHVELIKLLKAAGLEGKKQELELAKIRGGAKEKAKEEKVKPKMTWVAALKEWNKSQSSWCVPRKGTAGYDVKAEVKETPKGDLVNIEFKNFETDKVKGIKERGGSPADARQYLAETYGSLYDLAKQKALDIEAGKMASLTQKEFKKFIMLPFKDTTQMKNFFADALALEHPLYDFLSINATKSKAPGLNQSWKRFMDWKAKQKKGGSKKKFRFLSLEPSDVKGKKWRVNIMTPEGPRTVNFGAKGMGDFTTWPLAIKDKKRKLYLARHSGMGEDWGASGILTPGFWSKHLLWGETPNIYLNLNITRKKFNI